MPAKCSWTTRIDTCLDAFLDIFNVANRASFNNPTGDRRLADFLIVRSIVDGGPTRVAQLNVRYAF